MTAPRELAAEWVALDQLVPWRDNPKPHEDVSQVVDSIKRLGFGAPLVARRANREVLAGHGRLKAARALGMTHVPVRFLDLDEHEAHLYALIDNRSTELSPYDDKVLLDQLKKYDAPEVSLAGWTAQDLDRMAKDLLKQAREKPSDVTEDDVPDLPAVPVTKPGDIWQLGAHRLHCADATDASSYARLLDGVRAQLLVTDPPYGVSVTGGTHDPRDPNYRKGPERKTIANDTLTGKRLEQFLRGAFEHVSIVLDKGASWYVWFAGTETRAFIDAAEQLGGFKHTLVWVKPNFVFGRCDYHYRHEPCLYGWMPGAGHTWRGSRNQSSVFEVARDGAVAELKHPTVKPVRLYSMPIENHLEPGQAVLDPFAGSGPAFSAAEQTGRRCYGIELDPAYCDVIVERWQNLTGEKATRCGA